MAGRRDSVVRNQRIKWSAVRRLIKRAVQGDAALEPLYAEC